MNWILVVDDERSILEGLRLGLSSEDITVDCADAGKAAIMRSRQKGYDVLIVDLFLPDMHGLEVIRALKKQNPDLLSIIITAQPSRESVSEAMKLGVNDYLEKPFNINTIKDAISRAMAQRAQTGA